VQTNNDTNNDTNMLQNKDITKVQEIKALFKDTWCQPEFFSKHFDLLHFSKTSKIYKSVKDNTSLNLDINN
jgi:hypothetical protein